MKKKLLAFSLILILVFSCSYAAVAAEKLTSDSFQLHVKVINPEGTLEPSTLRFNLFTEDGEWLSNQHAEITEPGILTFTFPVPTYEIGKNFKVVATTGANTVYYYEDKYKLNEEFLVETYAYCDDEGNLIVCDEAHITVRPLSTLDVWESKAESVVNDNNIWSDTPYLIWVSKANFRVSVFLKENGEWDCIKHFPCSIGAPGTPTITGQYRYYQYQDKWDYGSYYVGPIMRFYGGYAIHSTLVNNNGTDRDGRVGKMISHGCVRVRPENINWLTYYVPLGTKIYITNS